MASKPMWMVRAGEGAAAITDFREKGVIAIGWGGTDWTTCQNKEAIVTQLMSTWPDLTVPQASAAASQIDRFLRGFKVEDRVITYDPSLRTYFLGVIKTEPQFKPRISSRISHGQRSILARRSPKGFTVRHYEKFPWSHHGSVQGT